MFRTALVGLLLAVSAAAQVSLPRFHNCSLNTPLFADCVVVNGVPKLLVLYTGTTRGGGAWEWGTLYLPWPTTAPQVSLGVEQLMLWENRPCAYGHNFRIGLGDQGAYFAGTPTGPVTLITPSLPLQLTASLNTPETYLWFGYCDQPGPLTCPTPCPQNAPLMGNWDTPQMVAMLLDVEVF